MAQKSKAPLSRERLIKDDLILQAIASNLNKSKLEVGEPVLLNDLLSCCFKDKDAQF